MKEIELIQISIATVKREIEEIFLNVHNRFSKNTFKERMSIYDTLEFGRTESEEGKERMKPFLEIYAKFIGFQETYDVETEEILLQYEEMKKELEEAKKNLLL